MEDYKEVMIEMIKDGIIPQKAVEKYCPELAENEDERTLEKLVSLITWSTSYNASGITHEDAEEMLSWLEKHCEQKPAEEYNITGIGSKNAQGKLGEMIKKLKPVNEILEQDSADKVEPKFKVGDKIQYSKGCDTIMTIEKIENGEYIFGNNMGHTTIEIGNKWYLVNPVEQKSDEWSDVRFTSTVQVLEYAHSLDAYNQYGKEDIRKNIKWLKSLKNRCFPQPQQEWSEEDKKKLNLALQFLNESKQNAPEEFETYGKRLSKKDYEDVVNWLKSLRPQSQWKPSNEQIKVCKEVYADLLSAKGFDLGTINSELNRLEEDLKKLKG